MDFSKNLDEKKAIDASSISSSSTPWKQRIVEYMMNKEDAACSETELLEKTDAKYDGTNYQQRKHCLASQLTYIRQDYKIETKRLADQRIVLLGVHKDDKVVPFKNAVQYL